MIERGNTLSLQNDKSPRHEVLLYTHLPVTWLKDTKVNTLWAADTGKLRQMKRLVLPQTARYDGKREKKIILAVGTLGSTKPREKTETSRNLDSRAGNKKEPVARQLQGPKR